MTQSGGTRSDSFILALEKDFPPQPGSFTTTSVLHWSFSEDSFWRAPDSATALDIAKSIALAGWREALGHRLFFSIEPFIVIVPLLPAHVEVVAAAAHQPLAITGLTDATKSPSVGAPH